MASLSSHCLYYLKTIEMCGAGGETYRRRLFQYNVYCRNVINYIQLNADAIPEANFCNIIHHITIVKIASSLCSYMEIAHL